MIWLAVFCGPDLRRDANASIGQYHDRLHAIRALGLGLNGLGLMFQGSGFRVQGSKFRVQGSGFRVQGSGFKVQGLEFGFGLRGRCARRLPGRDRQHQRAGHSCFRSRITGLGFQLSVLDRGLSVKRLGP